MRRHVVDCEVEVEMAVLLLSPADQRKGRGPLVVLCWRWIMLVTDSQLWPRVLRAHRKKRPGVDFFLRPFLLD